MTEAIANEARKPSFAARLRTKAWLSRWSLMLWASFALAISISSWLLFPGVHFWVDGGWQGIALVVSVDLVLGPTLFMLVANPAKSVRERRLEAITLFSIQLLAMSWGGWQVYAQRPVAVSYVPNGYLVPLVTQNFSQQKLTVEQLPSSRLGKLPAFYVSLPRTKNPFDALSTLLSSDIPFAANATLLSPLLDHEKAIFAQQPRFLAYWSGEGSSQWQQWSSRHGNKPASDYRFINFVGRYGVAVLVLNPDNSLAGHITLAGDGIPPALQGN